MGLSLIKPWTIGTTSILYQAGQIGFLQFFVPCTHPVVMKIPFPVAGKAMRLGSKTFSSLVPGIAAKYPALLCLV